MMTSRTSCTSRHTYVCRQLAAALVASALGASAYAETATGVALDKDFNASEKAAVMVTTSAGAAPVLKGLQRAAITSFQVEFVTKGAAGASSYEIGRSGSASTNLQITMVGLDKADFQAITDKLYDGFVSDLQQMQIEVVPVERVLAAPAYQRLAATGSASPVDTRTRDTWSTVYAPQGLAVYGTGSTSTAIPVFGAFAQFANIGTALTGTFDLQKELDAALLEVRMVVHFVDMQSSGINKMFGNNAVASVNWKFGPSVAATSTKMTVHRPTGTASMTLRAPLLVDGAAFKEVRDTTSIAANVGLAFLSAAIGKGGSATAVEKEAVADP
ncbi:MAG: hypothetical protein ABI281_01440, partial [Caldimonas sp.]